MPVKTEMVRYGAYECCPILLLEKGLSMTHTTLPCYPIINVSYQIRSYILQKYLDFYKILVPQMWCNHLVLRGHPGILFCRDLPPMRMTATIMGSGRKVKRQHSEDLVEIEDWTAMENGKECKDASQLSSGRHPCGQGVAFPVFTWFLTQEGENR